MHATIRLADSLAPRTFDHRATPRQAIALPILITVSGTRYNALIRNLSNAGAMIATSAPLSAQTKIEFQCGSICAGGAVIWQRQSEFGIRFDQPISERQLSEQVLRSDAASSRRKVPALTSVA